MLRVKSSHVVLILQLEDGLALNYGASHVLEACCLEHATRNVLKQKALTQGVMSSGGGFGFFLGILH